MLNFYAENNSGLWTIIIVIAVVIVVALVAFVWIRLVTKRSRFQKAILELDRKKNEINDLPIGFKLLRLEKIGNNNVVYAEVHREYKKKYDDLADEFNKDFATDYEACQRLLNEANYRKLAETIQVVENKLNTYDSKMKQLGEQIGQLTKDEDDTRNLEAELKTKNRECYEQYQKNHHELEILQDEFKEGFHQIDEKFKTYGEYMNRGNYTDAKEMLMMINDDLNEIEKQIQYAPKYTVVLTKDIPFAMNAVIDKYNDMQANGYPLFHILASSTINNIKDRLTRIVSKLKYFEYGEIDEQIAEIYKDIKDLDNQLNEEKKSRDLFDEESKKIYDEAEALERFYIKHIKEVADLRKVYVVNDKQSELESRFKVEIQKLSVIRSGMDSLNYGNQAYSTRLGKLNDLINQVKIVRDCKDMITNNIEGMRDNSDDAYNLVEEGATRLKNLEIQLRNSRVEKLIQNFADDFADGYYTIDKLKGLFNVTPIEIDKVQYYRDSLITLLNRLQNEIQKQIDAAKYAERLLMYANSLKNDTGGDRIRNISKAELYYYDGKYEDAIRIAISAIGDLPKFLEKGAAR